VNALLITGPRIAALAWARGDIGDREFVFDFPRVPEAMLFATLPDLASFRRVLPLMLANWQAGADIVILRTSTREVIRHAAKWGAAWTVREIDGKFRILARPEVVNRYLGRIAQKSAAAGGVTTAR